MGVKIKKLVHVITKILQRTMIYGKLLKLEITKYLTVKQFKKIYHYYQIMKGFKKLFKIQIKKNIMIDKIMK